MQNSEIYRRGFVVPLSEEAEQALMTNDVAHDTAVEFYELPDQETFEELYSIGFFNTINSNFDILLDDYEEDMVEETQVGILKELVEKFKDFPGISLQASNVVDGLVKLCNVALKHKRPIFFIL